MAAKRLILASASPRRRELLAMAGFAFDVVAADVDETAEIGESAVNYVRRVAQHKALAIQTRFPEAVVLGADTTVDLDGEILGKPRDSADARAMLLALSGRQHRVHTGLAVVCSALELVQVVTTVVQFGEIDAASLEAYLDSGEPLDKAGSYGIQGFAARWIPRIEGDYFNVVGLPVAATVEMLRRVMSED